MSLKNTFYEIAIKQAPKQSLVVDAITEESPILAGMPFYPSSNGLSNVYEEVSAITGAEIMDYDAAMSTMKVDSELKFSNLSSVGGEIEVGEDKALQLGGPDAYFASKLPLIMKESGNRIEYSLFYNSLRSYASTSGKLIDAGGTGSTNYTILCVKWSQGEMSGIYDPKGFGRNGNVFDVKKYSNGGLYKNSSGVPVYGISIKTFLGMQMANARNIAGIVNCDITNDVFSGDRTFPTEDMIDDMLDDARANSANTIIYCHPKVLSYLGKYKAARMTMLPGDANVNRLVSFWNGIPIMTSYNLAPGNEAKVTVA
jgi:hypothetical protein